MLATRCRHAEPRRARLLMSFSLPGQRGLGHGRLTWNGPGSRSKEEDSMNGTRNASSSSRHSTRAVGTCLTVLALWAIRGGLGVPLGPAVALDLNGRYVFLKQDGTLLPPR